MLTCPCTTWNIVNTEAEKVPNLSGIRVPKNCVASTDQMASTTTNITNVFNRGMMVEVLHRHIEQVRQKQRPSQADTKPVKDVVLA